MKKYLTYEEVLATLVPEKNTYGTQVIGHALYGAINPETLIKITLFRGDAFVYTGLELNIINKRHGVVDSVVIPFPVYKNENDYTLHKSLNKHTNPSDTLSWDIELTPEELNNIHTCINNYIDMFDALPDIEGM